LRASVSILAFLAILLPAVALSEPVALHGVACFDTSKAVLHNGTVLELPSLKPLAQLGSLDGCDIRGNLLAAWRAGEVRVYRGLEPLFTVRGERAFIGSRFVLVTARGFAAVHSLYGFQVLRLDRHTVPAAVWVLAAQKAGGKAVVLASPTTCRVRMQVESYLLVYDLDLGLWDIHQTGAVGFLAVPSGVVWVKNGTLYHNGRELGKAPDGLYPVSNLDGYAYTQGGEVVIVAMNGSTYALPLPSGRGLAVSKLSEGFAACSDYECTCTFNCTGFSEVARQAHAPPVAAETGAHYLLYANTVLYILEKPRPAPQPASTTAPQNATKPATGTTSPGNATAQPSAEQPGVLQPLNATETQPPPSAPAALNATRQASAAQPLNASGRSLSGVEHPPEQQTRAEPVFAWLLVAAAAAAVLAIYLLYRRRHL
jgi:hypothetical protein